MPQYTCHKPSLILNAHPAFNSTPLYFSLFLQSVKSSRAAGVLSPQFCVQPHHSPGAGAERLRGKGPMESRLVRSVGSRGPAGGVMGSVIVPAVWIGWGVKGWGEKPWKKRRGGDTSITCAPSDPSLPLSLHGQTHCLRGGARFHRQMHIPLLCSR